jgi:hypothetical protein
MTDHPLPPARQACQNLSGEGVFVTLGGKLPTGVEFCTVGVRDAEQPDTGSLVTRDQFRELIDMSPHDALNAAIALVHFASLALWRAENQGTQQQ